MSLTPLGTVTMQCPSRSRVPNMEWGTQRVKYKYLMYPRTFKALTSLFLSVRNAISTTGATAEDKIMEYEVWVSEHKYEDHIAWKGDSLFKARQVMNEQVGMLIGSPPVFDLDAMSFRMIHPKSGLEFWRVEIKEVHKNAA